MKHTLNFLCDCATQVHRTREFPRINGDTVEKIKSCFLAFFPSLAKLFPFCFPLALGELRVVLVESSHSAPNATVMGWERAEKIARLFLLKFLKSLMLNKTCVCLESRSLKQEPVLFQLQVVHSRRDL